MKRELRLWWGTFRAWWDKYWSDLSAHYIRRTCPHHWRAVRITTAQGDSPGKVCRICDTFETLTIEEFYAEFGEVGMGAVHK